MVEFSKDLITNLGELPTKQDFSVVHFGTEVVTASVLQSWRQVIKTLNRLTYTGGRTNLAGAINACQETLASSPPGRKNLMLVMTDGEPTVPGNNPHGAAANAAAMASDEDTFIIPIFIKELNNQNAPEVDFLQSKISSDGKVFVADFDSLGSLQETMFEQVTCQA
jgi:uncharacterized protein with von Willebrand factor type A (vWA) domain